MKNIYLKLWLIFLIALMVGGCKMGIPWAKEIPAKDLELRIRTDKETIEPGESVKVQFKLTNRSDWSGRLPDLAIHPDSLEIECQRGGANLCFDLEPDSAPKKVKLKPGKALRYELEFFPEVEEGEDFVLRALFQNRVKSNPVWVKIPRSEPVRYDDYNDYWSPY